MTFRRMHRLTLRIAMLAILLAALAPALAQLGGAYSGKTALPIDVCTHSGPIILVAGDTLPASDKKSPVKPCPWCKLHASVGIPPASSKFIHLALAAPTEPPRPDYPPLRGSPPHCPAAPRGPPAVS